VVPACETRLLNIVTRNHTRDSFTYEDRYNIYFADKRKPVSSPAPSRSSCLNFFPSAAASKTKGTKRYLTPNDNMTKTETKAEKEARELFDVKQACAETKKRRKAALKKQAEGEVEVQRLENEYKEAFSHIPTILKAATDSWEVAHDGEVSFKTRAGRGALGSTANQVRCKSSRHWTMQNISSKPATRTSSAV
jgi:hypothetical protein